MIIDLHQEARDLARQFDAAKYEKQAVDQTLDPPKGFTHPKACGHYLIFNIPGSRSSGILKTFLDLGLNYNEVSGEPIDVPPEDWQKPWYYMQSVFVNAKGRVAIHGTFYEKFRDMAASQRIERSGFMDLSILDLQEAVGVRPGSVMPVQKSSIALGLLNNTPVPLLFDVVLNNGTVEAKDMTLGIDETGVVHPGGELTRPSAKDGRNNFSAYYDADSPIATREEAERIASERGVSVPSVEAVQRTLQMLADKNPGADLSGLEQAFYNAKGRGLAMRLPLILDKADMFQASWGDCTQHNHGGDIIMFNADGSVYMIGAQEFIDSYVASGDKPLTGRQLYAGLPVIGNDLLEDFCCINSPRSKTNRDNKKLAELAGSNSKVK